MATTSYPSDWESRRKRVYQRDDFQCQRCGARGGPNGDVELHADHITPKSEGGSHRLENLQTLCYACHNDKHDHHVPRTTDAAARDAGPSTVAEVHEQYVDGEIDERMLETQLERALATDTPARDTSDSARETSTQTSDTSTDAGWRIHWYHGVGGMVVSRAALAVFPHWILLVPLGISMLLTALWLLDFANEVERHT